ncbi:hypothetical protein J437_LFUL004296 [Ladona fulva]|uniref:FATC domain-containing protein n=1 Tax=Ladona fulva TaxID=123851 RepID=A0A8K0JYW3_LADFU|nr:hypothetical protein J437_LFUL004296 [Ladona fulva]
MLRRHDIILSVMTVMVKEPFLDWLINFRMDHGIGKSTELVGSCNWNPKEIIRIAQRKFIGGVNPARITMELLDVRINDDALLKERIKDVVRGDLNHNIRTVLGYEGLSCEQQVSCLIDMATDYHILGKALINWEPKL